MLSAFIKGGLLLYFESIVIHDQHIWSELYCDNINCQFPFKTDNIAFSNFGIAVIKVPCIEGARTENRLIGLLVRKSRLSRSQQPSYFRELKREKGRSSILDVRECRITDVYGSATKPIVIGFKPGSRLSQEWEVSIKPILWKIHYYARYKQMATLQL